MQLNLAIEQAGCDPLKQNHREKYSAQTLEDYTKLIDDWKNTLDSKNTSVGATEMYGFPLPLNFGDSQALDKDVLTSIDKIFLDVWNDVLTVTNFRNPQRHVLSEFLHGLAAMFDLRNAGSEYSDLIDTMGTKAHGYCSGDTFLGKRVENVSDLLDTEEILLCLQQNVGLTYNSYVQIFSPDFEWDGWNRNVAVEDMHFDENVLNHAEKVLDNFDVILITELLNLTLVQLVPFGIVPNCSTIWHQLVQKRSEDSGQVDNTVLRTFHKCYNDFVTKNIHVVEPHYYIKPDFPYEQVSPKVKELTNNYTIWDQKLYEFAKKVAIKRSKLVFSGRMW